MSIGFDIFFEKISLCFAPFSNMNKIVTRFLRFVKENVTEKTKVYFVRFLGKNGFYKAKSFCFISLSMIG